MRSLIVELGRKALLIKCVALLEIGGRLMCQSLVIGERCPTMTTLSLCRIETVFLSKRAVQPLSQSWLIESKDC